MKTCNYVKYLLIAMDFCICKTKMFLLIYVLLTDINSWYSTNSAQLYTSQQTLHVEKIDNYLQANNLILRECMS